MRSLYLVSLNNKYYNYILVTNYKIYCVIKEKLNDTKNYKIIFLYNRLIKN
jgi:hypothetical protein